MNIFSSIFGPSKAELEAEKRVRDLEAAARAAIEQVESLKKELADKEPKATETLDEHGQLTVTNWNAAYAASKRAILPPELANPLTDEEVVKLWVERRNYEHEEPRLEVVHGEITDDGHVSLKLEWNNAFIRQLQNQGFAGATEDELVQNYLHQVTKRVDTQMLEHETPDVPLVPPTEDDVEAILDKTDPETLRVIERSVRRRAAQRGRNRNLDPK